MTDKEYTTRLRRTAKGYDNGGILGMVINECADKIDELEKRITELESALKPFATIEYSEEGTVTIVKRKTDAPDMTWIPKK